MDSSRSRSRTRRSDRNIRIAHPDVLVLVVSGYFYKDDPAIQTALEDGLIHGFIEKPFSHEEIRSEHSHCPSRCSGAGGVRLLLQGRSRHPNGSGRWADSWIHREAVLARGDQIGTFALPIPMFWCWWCPATSTRTIPPSKRLWKMG